MSYDLISKPNLKKLPTQNEQNEKNCKKILKYRDITKVWAVSNKKKLVLLMDIWILVENMSTKDNVNRLNYLAFKEVGIWIYSTRKMIPKFSNTQNICLLKCNINFSKFSKMFDVSNYEYLAFSVFSCRLLSQSAWTVEYTDCFSTKG